MHILITRPKHQAEQLMNAMQQYGHSYSLLPVLDVVPIDFNSEKIQKVQLELDTADRQIFISPNAVSCFNQLGLKSGELNFAIGEKTAIALKALGYRCNFPKQEFHSEGLLAMPQMQYLNGQNVAIICGLGGREYLEQKLAQAGAIPYRIELYERKAMSAVATHAIDLADFSEVDILTAMSVDTVVALQQFIQARSQRHWLALPMMVPSNRVATAAKELGFKHPITFEKPNAEALLNAIALI